MKKDATDGISFASAKLNGFRRSKVRGVKYPALIQTDELDLVEGVLISGLTALDFKYLDWFEGDEYERVSADVETAGGEVAKAYVYKWIDSMERLEPEDWDESWLQDHEKVDHWLTNEIESLDNCPP